jgi:hypothetical protein
MDATEFVNDCSYQDGYLTGCDSFADDNQRHQGTQEKNLRKTALGASSPAKPALHIPELF